MRRGRGQMFSLLQMAFSAELFAWGCSSLGGFELKDPGAVFGLVGGVERFVVGRAGLPHFPEDFEPALAEATQGAGMALAFGAMSAVVGLRPRAGFAAVVGPLMDGAAQGEIAGAAQAMASDLP